MKITMVHENYNVTNLEKSIQFYADALDLHEKCRKLGDGFVIVYLESKDGDFLLELTELQDHPQPYDLGECEFHMAFAVSDFDAAYKKHSEMGCICFENTAMHVYFIEDPDGYWLEIVPENYLDNAIFPEK